MKEDEMAIRLAIPGLLVVVAFGAISLMGEPAHAQGKKDSELAAAGYKQLSGAEITATLAGNTVYAYALADIGPTIKTGGKMTIYYRDAKTRIMAPSGGPNLGKKFESNWWIEGNFMCWENRIDREGNSCAAVYQRGSTLYTCQRGGGRCQVEYRVVPGNPDGI
jgi:hypothetical protein